MSFYDPADWYWAVAGNVTDIWSSQRVAYVPVSDATYAAWLAAGGKPSNIASAADLIGVLLAQWAPIAMGAGVAIVSGGTPALDGTYALDPASQAKIAALSTGIAASKPLPGGGSTFNYPDAMGTQHAFTSAAFLDLAAAIEGFVYDFTQAVVTLANGGTAALPTQPITIA